MTDFIVYPAIDLHEGKVVRLRQGDLAQQTTYGDDPAAFARRWFSEGARWLHLVNLDGAFEQSQAANLQAVQSVAALQQTEFPGAFIQFGGGVRSLEMIEQILLAGIRRVILGTAAVTDPELVAQAVARFGADRLAAGLDVKDGKVAIRGWVEQSPFTALELARRMAAAGLRTIIYTDISRDGTSTGGNLAATMELAKDSGMDVILSGGVASLDDIRRAAEAGLAGAITGRALYEGAFSLAEALRYQKEGKE
jgi:phosphoribosylformimino-5-aminoimidazole carboxamide ribotide isomerase